MTSTFSICAPALMGFGASLAIGEKCAELGVKKAILVFDQGVENAGLTKGVEKSLKDAGIDYVVFKDVAADPTDVSIEAGGKVGREAKVEAVIGVGGGSVLDTAKGINVLMGNPSPLSDYFLGGKPTNPGLPIFLIPTTGGTGSECTLSCIVTDVKARRKTTIRSKNCNLSTLAIVDPELMMGLPPLLTAITGIDAFAHAAECATNNKTNPVSDALAKEAIGNLVRHLPRAVADGSDREAREKVAISAMMAGTAFANSLPHLGHCFGHSIGATLHLPHGLAVGAAIAQALCFVSDAVPEKIRAVGSAMGLDMSSAGDPISIGRKVGEAVLKFKEEIKLPALKDQKGVTREAVVSAHPLVTKDGCYPFSAKKLTEDQTKELLGKMYDGVL
ncbi:MAG: iron-containing alcohol dehydrogenase [Deltaproteobacteria bacterium]|jgi:alcohol dehydrogenase|nr:iron-containing alcohol dehydrogenase [Deltaproteobacteria bacterium]